MKIKFNLMDAFIITVLIAVIAGGTWFMTSRGKQQAEISDKTVSVMVELTNKDDEFSKLPQVGDIVIMGEKEKMKTKVTDVKVMAARMISYDVENGRILDSEIPNRYDVRITMQAAGMESPKEVTINGSGVRVGMGIALKAKNWSGYGYALSVETE